MAHPNPTDSSTADSSPSVCEKCSAPSIKQSLQFGRVQYWRCSACGWIWVTHAAAPSEHPTLSSLIRIGWSNAL